MRTKLICSTSPSSARPRNNGATPIPDAEGNIRDHAPLEQLVVLTNLESLNSVLIRQSLPQPERLLKLNEIAITQMRTLLSANNVKRLK